MYIYCLQLAASHCSFNSDVNECDHPDTYPCHGICTNTDGGYRCDCVPGFAGNASVPTGCKGTRTIYIDRKYECYVKPFNC